jgi:Uma2 family endonuclease
MTIATAEPRSTPDDVLRLEDQGLYELVGGRLVEKSISSLATETAGILTVKLGIFLRQNPLGRIYPEQSFQCFPHDPDLIRRPDIAFVRNERLSQVAETGHVKVRPDLAIEIISPTDTIYQLDEKLADYRSAGILLVWVVDPKWKTVRVHRADRTVSELFEGDSLSGEQVLPGFVVPVGELMPKSAPHV